MHRDEKQKGGGQGLMVEGRSGGLVFNGDWVSAGENGKVLELNGADGWEHHVNYNVKVINVTKLHLK